MEKTPDEIADDILDQACLGEPHVRNGVDAALRKDIAEAIQAERDEIEGPLTELDSALTVLIKRINGEKDLASAAKWVRLNYPKRASELKPLAPL